MKFCLFVNLKVAGTTNILKENLKNASGGGHVTTLQKQLTVLLSLWMVPKLGKRSTTRGGFHLEPVVCLMYLGPLWSLPYAEAKTAFAALCGGRFCSLAVQVPGVDERAILQVVNTHYLPLLDTSATGDGAGPPLSSHPPGKNTENVHVLDYQKFSMYQGIYICVVIYTIINVTRASALCCYKYSTWRAR